MSVSALFTFSFNIWARMLSFFHVFFSFHFVCFLCVFYCILLNRYYVLVNIYSYHHRIIILRFKLQLGISTHKKTLMWLTCGATITSVLNLAEPYPNRNHSNWANVTSQNDLSYPVTLSGDFP